MPPMFNENGIKRRKLLAPDAVNPWVGDAKVSFKDSMDALKGVKYPPVTDVPQPEIKGRNATPYTRSNMVRTEGKNTYRPFIEDYRIQFVDDVREWCDHNLHGTYRFICGHNTQNFVYFEIERDATLFKLFFV